MTTEEFEHEAGLLRPMLVATAARMLGSDSRAEDAAQETLAKLWMMRGELRSPMAALARAVVRNLCVWTASEDGERLPFRCRRNSAA